MQEALKCVSGSERVQSASSSTTPSLHHFLWWRSCLCVTCGPQSDESAAKRSICFGSVCPTLVSDPNLSERGRVPRADGWATLLYACCPIGLPRRCFLSLSWPLLSPTPSVKRNMHLIAVQLMTARESVTQHAAGERAPAANQKPR